MEEDLKRKGGLPINSAELESGLGREYTKVPNVDRLKFLEANKDNKYFIVNRRQPADPREALPFSVGLEAFKESRGNDYYIFQLYSGTEYPIMGVSNDDELYMIGPSTNQSGGKRRNRVKKSKRKVRNNKRKSIKK